MRQRLLILLSSLNAGGAETQTVRLVNQIDTDKFDVTLRYFDRREALLDDIDLSQVSSLECFDRKGRFDLSLLTRLKNLIDEEQHDQVLCISPYPLMYAYLIKLIYGKKFRLVTALHQTQQRPGLWHSVKIRLFRRFLNRSDLILFVCRNQLEYWVDHHGLDGRKCAYIYNGIDVEHFSTALSADETAKLADQLGIGDGDIVLVNVAGFRNEKKQEDIVHAVRKLRDLDYPIKAVLVGDGPRRNAIERYVQSFGVQNHVFLAGLQRDVRPYLHIADCFVISSHQETFSVAVLEAMAAGKPVVLTNVGGAEEMVEDGVQGFLYPAGDVDQLVEKVRNLIDLDSFETMGNECRKTVSERFTLQKMVLEYERILSDP